MEKEIWKDVVGYEGMYLISNFAKIKSLDKVVRTKGFNATRIHKGKMLSCRKTDDGYVRINLSKENKKKTYKIHRLVAEAFIENVYNKPTINHIDGNKENNIVNNLEWMDWDENYNHYKTTKGAGLGPDNS